jgi:hypothetical protein
VYSRNPAYVAPLLSGAVSVHCTFRRNGRPLRRWSCQLPRHQSLPVCASRPSCPPRVLVGPISILFPVLGAEILSSARRAKAVVNQMSRIIPGTLRGSLAHFRTDVSTTSPGIPSRAFASLYEYAHSPILSERVRFDLRPPCARRCSLYGPVSCGRRFPGELCLPSREGKISLTQVFVWRSEKLRST